ncbi:MAG: transposase, partial [Rickettsia endosymbiont of Eriopis connexa]|nr:transposase [Rickettsia endosymbiont of Eriopis connexa]
YLLELKDKTMLRKRSLIESVFNILKNRMNLEHTRHRSPVNFLVHILVCVTAYAITKSHTKLDVLAPEKHLLS